MTNHTTLDLFVVYDDEGAVTFVTSDEDDALEVACEFGNGFSIQTGKFANKREGGR